MHSENKSCALVTVYFPDEGFSQRLQLIAAQVDHAIVVDNSEDGSFIGVNLPNNAEIYRNHNRGALAGALNFGLARVRQMGFEHLITFDQDSTVPEGLVKQMAGALDQRRADVIGPNFINAATGAPGRFNLWKNGWSLTWWFRKPAGLQQVHCLITSGMMIAVDRLPPQLKYREDFLVDVVDTEFCLKARRMGCTIVVDTTICMVHQLGNRRHGSGRFSAMNYSPRRRYLMSRNRIVMWVEYFRVSTSFVLTDVVLAIVDILRTILYEGNKKEQWKAYMRGFHDGMKMIRSKAS